MTASLIVAGYELLGSSTNPEYRLAPGFDFGAGEPDQTTISSLYLDGDTVSGERTRNRTIDLPINVLGSNPVALAKSADTLLQAVSSDTFTTQWTPDGGLPVLFDCYRAVWSRPNRSLVKDAAGQTALRITFQAKPFGRSTTVQTVGISTTTQIDSLDTAPTGATLDTSHHIEGTGSAKYTTATSPTISRTFAAKDLSAATKVTVYQQVSAAGDANTATVQITLSSSSGSTRYSGSTFTANSGGWNLLTVNLTGGTVVSGTGATLSAVTGYSLNISNTVSSPTSFYVDDLRASGAASAQVATTHGVQALLPGVVGSARTPASLTLSNGATFAAFLIHTPPGDQDVSANILSSLSTGSTNQTVTIAAGNAHFAGTYVAMLGVGTSGGGSVTATITVTQLENGTAVGSTQVLTKTYTSGALLIPVDEITLPLYEVPSDNTLTTYTFQVQISGADRYSELMLLDTAGQTVWTDSNLSTARVAAYIDEPSALQSGPPVYASATDRTAAFSIAGNCVLSGGPIQLDPGANKALIWTGTGTPNITATYYPRWLDERVT